MLIMLDGQDRCMKDTTIEQLRKHLKTPRIQVFHEGKRDKWRVPIRRRRQQFNRG
jgi:thymidylate kinase